MFESYNLFLVYRNNLLIIILLNTYLLEIHSDSDRFHHRPLLHFFNEYTTATRQRRGTDMDCPTKPYLEGVWLAAVLVSVWIKRNIINDPSTIQNYTDIDTAPVQAVSFFVGPFLLRAADLSPVLLARKSFISFHISNTIHPYILLWLSKYLFLLLLLYFSLILFSSSYLHVLQKPTRLYGHTYSVVLYYNFAIPHFKVIKHIF